MNKRKRTRQENRHREKDFTNLVPNEGYRLGNGSTNLYKLQDDFHVVFIYSICKIFFFFNERGQTTYPRQI